MGSTKIKMINFSKLEKKFREKGITSTLSRQKGLIPQSTLTKIKMCSGENIEEISHKLEKYKEQHNGKEFACDVSTKTIEDICQLLQCQPCEILDWEVELKPELSFENRMKEESE